nr:hypothetical protein BaRGS_034862 [Batillaria attramentaria]
MEGPPETFLDWSKYQGVFNWTLHYRRDADLVGVYGDVVPHSFSGSGPIIAVDTNVEHMRNYAREKSKMVAWMASNCVDDARRQRMVQIPITDNDVHSSGKVPRGSYIQIGDFASIKDLAVYLKKVRKD